MSNPSAAVDIDAPLDTVWSVMIDTDRYPDWNPFVFRVESDGPPEVGRPIKLHAQFKSGKQVVSPERITVFEPPYDDDGTRRATLAYVFEGWPAKLGLVKGTRWQRLSQREGEPTRYETVEEFSGPLVPLAGPGRVEDVSAGTPRR
jgi:hypothetical protein